MDFERGETGGRVGFSLGFFAAYLLFTCILTLLLTILDKQPQGGIPTIIGFTLAVAIIGESLRRWLG